MALVNPYLNFLGTTEAAFNHYKSVFGGEFSMLLRYRDTPEAGDVKEEDKDKIMHMALPIGNGNILMGTDALGSMQQGLQQGNNFYLSVHADSKPDADRVFKGLSEDGQEQMAMQDTFWGAYFGMLKDKFGVQWMVSFEQPRTQ
ncbi:VOC family protein [Solitalea sp. MAHUQ-68]|uniref:VOC family protein n=1 Tax=Solitalea agri TaxID=2953739 RepID=A0A9X2F279_9SPHI|nr:VOC family protein [Solitalea agri]MCO4293324.1 VOC family protein [Solitalea agri]